jgi:hypothetical protein
VPGLEHDDTRKQHGREREERGEQREPSDLHPERGQAPQRHCAHDAGRQRGKGDDQREDDHEQNR